MTMQEEKIKKSEHSFKETLVTMKNSLYKEILEIENNFNKNYKKDLGSVREELLDRINHISINIKDSTQQNNMGSNGCTKK